MIGFLTRYATLACFLGTFAVFGLGVAKAADPAAPGPRDAARPNLVVFLVDDLGWQGTSVPFSGEVTAFNRHFQTPALAQFARLGVRFTDAHSCCVCSPTRISLLTGQNAARHGTTDILSLIDQNPSGKTSRLKEPHDWGRAGLLELRYTLPRLLHDQGGYRTIHIGKTHVGAVGMPASLPRAVGFDVDIGSHAVAQPGSYQGEDNYSNPSSHLLDVPGLEAYHGTETHLTDALTLEACRAVTEAVATGQPFYLQLSHYAVHAPIQPHARFLGEYQGQKYQGTDIPIPEIEANYASMVRGVDSSLGQLLEKLEELKVAENTVLVFLSDNGALSHVKRDTTPLGTGRNTHSLPLREGKGSAYEGGTRVPLVVAWAKRNENSPLQRALPIAADQSCSVPMIVEDLYPTLLRMAGVTSRPPDASPIDGDDLTPLLSDPQSKGSETRAEPLVFHFPHQRGEDPEGGYQPHSSLRQGPWKAIYFYETRRWELYNLQEDIGETKNLAGAQPDTLSRLAALLRSLLVERKASWPVNRHTKASEPLLLPEEIEFPDREWRQRTPQEAGLDAERLDQLAQYLGGRGMVTRDGYEVFTWGDARRTADVASAVKPWFTHFLVEAVQSSRLPDFDTPVALYRPELLTLNGLLDHKDGRITFRHCATQTSCYGVQEAPGTAFDYNDFQMALFCDTLFTKVYGVPMADVDDRLLSPLLTSRLECEDRPSLLAWGDSDRAGRLRISPRDFCRFGLLYMRGGVWRGQTIVEPELAHFVTHSPLPANLPRTQAEPAEMLPGQRTLGSTTLPDDQTDHFGSYSWLWWVNGLRASQTRLWPDAPADTYACLGHRHGKRGMAVIPAWDIVISWNDTTLDQKPWPDMQTEPHPLNEAFRLLRPTVVAEDRRSED